MGEDAGHDLGHADTQHPADDEVRLMSPPVADGLARYGDPDKVLGRGGMGVVSLIRDVRIGRRVAKKALRPELARAEEARARFVREAQVQGQLEHPAIVPVYDLARDEDGAPYFTMKSIRGVTLEEILRRLADRDAGAAETFGRHRLLAAFSTVCLAAHYAHQRGVLHRDLKPANIMLGEYGEVYVLDWGLARIRHADNVEPAERIDVEHLHEAMTHVGTVMGTPGYVAPEQVRADAGTPDRRCDVYALGSVLFEILTLQKLHTPGPVKTVIQSTVQGADARASVRAPDRDIAPELDAICQRATAVDPKDRYPDARELHDAVQRVLAGERDLALRREKSREHSRLAARAAAEMKDGDDAAHEARRTAMRELGRALALDPENADAVETMIRLLGTAPDGMPAEVESEIEKSYRRRTRWIGGIGAGTYLAIFGFLPLLWWMGIRQPLVVGAGFALLIAAAGFSLKAMSARRPPTSVVLAALIFSTLAFVFIGRLFGSLILVPAAIAVNATGYSIFLERKWRPLVVLLSVAAIAGPLGLELAGVLSASYGVTADGFVVYPGAVDFPAIPTLIVLTMANLMAVIIGTVVVGHIRDRLAEAEHRIYMYAWHLRELVPPAARSTTDPTA
ncbi:MAG TPA: protein kinase [Kofleriaceae bacterium]|nr:protein kinase [Kofleriaceae bacterium]